MTDSETKALKARDKREVTTPTEQTKPGPLFTPAVDIFETDQEPGVKAKDLNIDLRDDILTLDGEVETPEGKSEVDVFREYQSGKYSRQFSLSQVIDQAKIDAELKDGVLRLKLPKVAAATPRKIAVKAV
ncbi:MAG: Hsp20/alpha crystallin family protein [Deltaproteobacteria bacterium]|nr:Hsp20/alpha crystallin family protein [Deltaproteobacteria bacterium]